MENKTTFFSVNSIAEMYFNGDKKIKKQAVEKLFTVIYFNLKDFKIFLDEDTSSDFLLYIYPNLENLLKRYHPEKSLFSTFLHMNLQYNLISFIRKKSKKARLNEAILAEKTQTMLSYLDGINNTDEYNFYTAESCAEYCIDICENKNEKNVLSFFKRKDVSMQTNDCRRTVFFLACKSAIFLDDELIFKIANFINMPVPLLKKHIENLKEKSGGIIERIEKIKTVRDKNYIKKIACDRRLNADEIGIYEKTLLQRARKFSSNRFKEALNKNKKQVKCPSNRTIAETLKISRGTVDKNIAKIGEDGYNTVYENIFGIFKPT